MNLSRDLVVLLGLIIFQVSHANARAQGGAENPFAGTEIEATRVSKKIAEPENAGVMMFADWSQIQINGTNSSRIVADSANYHVQLDAMFIRDEGQVWQLHPSTISNVVLFGRTFECHVDPESTLNPAAYGYFEVLVDGELSLFTRHYIEKQTLNNNPLGMTSTQYDEIVRTHELYFNSGSDKQLREVPRKRIEFYDIFETRADAIAEYARNQGIGFKDPVDVTRLFKYYNRLLSPVTAAAAQGTAPYPIPFANSEVSVTRVSDKLASPAQAGVLLFDHWSDILIVGVNSSRLRADFANYNVQLDAILVMEEGRLFKVNPSSVRSLMIDGRKFESHLIGQSQFGTPEFRYFEVLTEGEFNLLSTHELETQTLNNNPLGMAHTQYEQLIRKQVLYYRTQDSGELLELPRKKSAFYDIFGANASAIIDYAKSERLGHKDAGDVTAIFRHYNNLTP